MPVPLPFDLTTFVFTPEDDDVIIDETIAVDGASDPMVIGILNPGNVDALDGNDVIESTLDGTLDFTTSDVIGLYNGGLLETGEGRDEIIGEVDFSVLEGSVESNLFGIASGIAVEPAIHTGDDNDKIIGSATLTGRADMVVGIYDTYADTGDGRDEIVGSATINHGTMEGGNNGHSGIAGSMFDTGDGNDKITGTVDAIMTAGQDAIDQEGIRETDFDTGDGRDTVEGKVTITSEGSAVVSGAGIGFGPAPAESANGILGGGNDKLIGEFTANLGDGSNVDGARGIMDGSVEAGSGRDSIEGIVDISLGDDTFSLEFTGIDETIITTEGGNDTVSGSASVEAGMNASVQDVVGILFSNISTGDGRDLVEGIASIDADELVIGTGVGISFSAISTGEGDDTVIGIGPDVEGATVLQRSFGIEESTLVLGDGDDEVFARGTDAGVRNTNFFGNEGDDIFDLDSGTGFVDGGEDDDLLILSGNKADFDFTFTGVAMGNIVTEGGSATNLNVANIEEFQFDDGTCSFDDLFIPF